MFIDIGKSSIYTCRINNYIFLKKEKLSRF